MLTTKRYEYLNADKIAIHPTLGNHRQLNSSKVKHLEKDIIQNGLLEPLVVWERTPGEYYLVGGFHRFEAIGGIRKNNPGYFENVDVRVVAGDPDEIRALNLKLNADRVDIKVTDYFETVIYLNNVNWPKERIAEFLDKSVSWIEEIIRFAPMVNAQLRSQLESGEISWNRAKEIISKTLKAPAGMEQETLATELEKQQSKSVRPLTFKKVIGHFSKMSQSHPKKKFTLDMNDLYSLIITLHGKNYEQEHLERVKELFPDLISN